MADARLLVGRPVARALNEAVLGRAERFLQRRGRKPRLVVFTSNDPSAESYLKSIRQTAGRVSVDIEEVPLSNSSSTDTVLSQLEGFNANEDVDGILIQTPVPEGIDLRKLTAAINPQKDIDGVSPVQAGMLFHGIKGALAPSTARACMEILDFYKYSLQGCEVVVIGRSQIVGRPVALLALSRNATVTWCHTKTQSIAPVCKRAEILIVAAGRAGMVNASYVRPGATVIDVGINVDKDGKIAGDVDAQSIMNIAAAYTPVPGGVGPVTTACLFANLLDASESVSGK